MSFSSDTAVQRSGDLYRARICPGWDIVGNANGGYLMAMGARAMALSSRPHPVSLTAHFLSPGRVGEVSISPTVIKAGRNFSTVRASIRAGERTLLELLGSYTELARIESAVRIDATPPELPDPEDCIRVVPGESGFPPPIMGRMDMRLHPEDGNFLAGKPSGRPLVRGWVRLLDDEPVDAFGLICIADAFPPTIFNANLPVAWTPTLEMTTQVRGLPEPGWLRCKFSTRFITGGMLEEDGEVWDNSGRLVALSRQLALVPRERSVPPGR